MSGGHVRLPAGVAAAFCVLPSAWPNFPRQVAVEGDGGGSIGAVLVMNSVDGLTHNTQVTDERIGIRKDLLIAEYNAVRAVAGQKATAAQATATAYMTLVSVVLGFVVSAKADIRLLLLIPALSTTFGITILGRYRSRDLAAQYIRRTLRPLAVEYGGDRRLLGWDEYHARHADSGPIAYKFGLYFLFPGLTFLVMLVTLPALRSLLDWAAWGLDLVLFVGFLSVYGARYRRRLLRLTRRYVGDRLRRGR